MFLYVIATKVLPHFIDNDMELKYQKLKLVNFANDVTISSGDINWFSRLKPIRKLYERVSNSNIEFSRACHYGPGHMKTGLMNNERWYGPNFPVKQLQQTLAILLSKLMTGIR